jgi:hypothetical protein
MRPSKHRRVLVVASALVLLSFTVALLEASAGHTDDGCQVEMHCFACHWAFASAGVLSVAGPVLPSLDQGEAFLHAPPTTPCRPPASSLAARGPPLA